MYGYIYMILNKVNGKKYIGQRKSKKFCHQDKYMGSGKKLAPAIKHYGIENFEKLLVQYVETAEEANDQEIFWIAHYDTTNPEKGYNISKGGNGIRLEHSWNAGKKGIYSKETLQKMRKAKEGNKNALGHKLTDEGKQKMSEMKKGNTYRKGAKHTKESKEKMAKSHKGKGHPQTEETKEKIRNSHKGKVLSEEHKKHLSEAKKGKHWKLVDGKRVFY